MENKILNISGFAKTTRLTAITNNITRTNNFVKKKELTPAENKFSKKERLHSSCYKYAKRNEMPWRYATKTYWKLRRVY